MTSIKPKKQIALIATNEGLLEVAIIGNLYKHREQYWFKRMNGNGGFVISELTTGFRLPESIQTWSNAEAFLDMHSDDFIADQINHAKSFLDKHDIFFPVNQVKDFAR